MNEFNDDSLDLCIFYVLPFAALQDEGVTSKTIIHIIFVFV